MRMRTSIGRLLAVVGFCGLGFGALREADAALAICLFALTMLSLGLAGLGAAIGRGPGYLGFALAGGVYSTLAFAPWFSGEIRPSLPTTWAIDNLAFSTTRIGILECPDDDTIVPGPGPLNYIVNTNFQRWAAPSSFTITPPRAPIFGLPAMTYRQWVGHSLSALILALMGSLAGRRLASSPRAA